MLVVLRPVDPVGAYNRWDWFRKGIQCAIDKTGAHMRPEDAYIRIRNNTAWLYVITVDDKDIGFVILTQEHDPDGPVLFIWTLWSEPGKLAPHVTEFYAALDQLANAIKAKRVRAQSPRRGYEGFDYVKPVAIVYEKEMGV